mmetsp:Transcript_10730/g.15916  ORF Transcript_10730/g.15916 Transcript_10730/m.15916 type:complete len:121 (+) Transcript_10730:959-1321(+)
MLKQLITDWAPGLGTGWAPSHTGIEGNERADFLANLAVERGTEIFLPCPLGEPKRLSISILYQVLFFPSLQSLGKVWKQGAWDKLTTNLLLGRLDLIGNKYWLDCSKTCSYCDACLASPT